MTSPEPEISIVISPRYIVMYILLQATRSAITCAEGQPYVLSSPTDITEISGEIKDNSG